MDWGTKVVGLGVLSCTPDVFAAYSQPGQSRSVGVAAFSQWRLSASGGFQPDRDDANNFAYWVLQAIGRGSSHVSPFLHTTRVLQVAKNWQQLGRTARGDMRNYLVRINRAALDPARVVDMSTKARQDLPRLAASSPTARVAPPAFSQHACYVCLFIGSMYSIHKHISIYFNQTCIILASDLHHTCIILASDLHRTCIGLA